MKAPPLDLLRPNRPASAVGLLLLVAAVVALVAAMQYLDALRTQGAELDERESDVAREEGRRRLISIAHSKPVNPQTQALMARQKYATEPARDLIEGGWRPQIAFLTLEVATEPREINMVFETKSVQDALSYADWLLANPATERVVLRRQTEKPGPPIESVETNLQVVWRALHRDEAPPASADTPMRVASNAGAPR
ncbi:hypothetical protein [Lysobacter arvi]|uniref:General secretion pathway protein GspM n=1 Tax=Lysobacter arvi TaxID=3038776 RepID=A0ABU1CBN2_9GAMM|nr:hypothetical protein [Lysobacter arvi]MDR0182586.1 hypothetical protein [Lysobacter arvi]